MPKYYDPATDEYREATQADVDMLARSAQALGNLVLYLRASSFHPDKAAAEIALSVAQGKLDIGQGAQSIRALRP